MGCAGLQHPQIPANRAWHMLILLRISAGFREMVCSATWPSIAVPYFAGSTTVTAATIAPFDTRFDRYICGVQSPDLR